MDEIRVSLAGDYVNGILQVVNNEGFFSVMDAEMTHNTIGYSLYLTRLLLKSTADIIVWCQKKTNPKSTGRP